MKNSRRRLQKGCMASVSIERTAILWRCVPSRATPCRDLRTEQALCYKRHIRSGVESDDGCRDHHAAAGLGGLRIRCIVLHVREFSLEPENQQPTDPLVGLFFAVRGGADVH